RSSSKVLRSTRGPLGPVAAGPRGPRCITLNGGGTSLAMRRVLRAALALLAAAGCAVAQTSSEPPVRIYYDELRIPHVFATTDEGVFRGLGYSQVRDFPVATLANLWSATGRFAEVAGPLVLARDERMRQWGIDSRAQELATDPDELDPGARVWLQAYVD